MGFRTIINKIRGVTDIPTCIKHGLTVGENVFINYGCDIDSDFCWLITIGSNVTLAPRVHILAHDASTKRELGYTKIGKVTIGSNVFVGANTIILPGVTVGDKVVIGAGSVVTKDIPTNSVAAGNPARVICSYDEYMKKQRDLIVKSGKSFDRITNDNDKKIIKEYLSEHKIGYIK